jgi:hypothetical protein
LNTDPPAEFLEHIDASPPVWRVHQKKQRSAGFEQTAQNAEARVGVFQVMEDSGANNLIEARIQFVSPLDWKLVELEILQVVFALEFLGAAHTGCAKVDTGHLRVRPAQGMFGCLRRSAAGNKYGMIFSKSSGRPKQMIIGAAPFAIPPKASITVKAVNRPRIWVALVEVLDFRRHAGQCRNRFFLLAHGKSSQMFMVHTKRFPRQTHGLPGKPVHPA